MAAKQHPPNLRDDVRKKINVSSEYQKQISSLQSQLQETRFEYDQLQDKLLEYSISVPTQEMNGKYNGVSAAPFTIGINKLPDEMLLQVFTRSLSFNHRCIRTLLMVCKYWYHVVMQTPRLWARIQLMPVYFIKCQSSDFSSILYIKACLQRSQSLLLDIDIEYENLRSCKGYIQGEIERTMEAIVGPSEGFEDSVMRWASELQGDFPSSKYDEYFKTVLKDMETLLGDDGANMRRWRTLILSIPWLDSEVAFTIWTKFVGSTPSLECLTLQNIECLWDVADWSDGLDVAFPTLPSVRSITLNDSGGAFFLSYLSVTLSSLLCLDIHYDGALCGFPLLLKLSLRTLIGARVQVIEKYRRMSSPLFVVRLPRLQEFNITGNSHLLSHVEFQFPNLKELMICSRDGFHLPLGLSPTRVFWSTMTHGHNYWKENLTTFALKAVLQSFERIEVVGIDEFASVYVPQVVSEIRNASSLPTSLRSIVVKLTNRKRDFIDVP